MIFGALGTSGTDYSLVIAPSTSQVCVTDDSPMPIEAHLYDYNN
jgi:hypothetical protein